MKVSVNWLKQYLDFELPAVDELVTKIGAQLGAVEEVIDLASRYDKAVVADVLSSDDLPDSDHLHLCYVDDKGVTKDVERRAGDGAVQVVCGASNVRAGLKVVWLPPGAVVPATAATADPFTLEARKLRGQISNGMIASAKELAIGEDHSGILDLTQAKTADGRVAVAGQPFAALYGLDDQIIDIENKMFTHRPDCFGLLGVAREVAGIMSQPFKSPDWYLAPPSIAAGNGLNLRFSNELPNEAKRFMLLPMKNVKVGPSPLWLQTLLTRAGMRPLNNVVDATNYIMLLTGQPTHAYDYDKVAALSDGDGASIVVRNPHTDEKLELLNGKTVTPRPEAIMIATNRQAIGLAGVMGGAATEVDNQTTNIILEVANFDMYSIRKTSMAHGLFTDAVTRFNKGQSPLQNPAILAELSRLLGELAGAQPAGEVIDDNHAPASQPSVTVSAPFINERLGLKLSASDMAALLGNVEFEVKVEGDQLTVQAPFWRTDIELREDVVEEVGRLYGYDHLPLELPNRDITPAPVDPTLELKAKIRAALAASGANEVLTYSFVHGNLLDKTGQSRDHAFKLSNAQSPDLQYFRQSLMPSLLELVHPNIKAGYNQFALFELGKGHLANQHDDAGLPHEDDLTALVVAAADKLKKPQAAYYQARAYLEELIPADLRFEPVPEDMQQYDITKPYDMSRAAFVYSGEAFLGIVGEFRPAVRQALKLPTYCAGFELDTLALANLLADGRPYTPLPRFPEISQDICLKVAADLPYGQLAEFVQTTLEQTKPTDSLLTIKPLDIYRRQEDADHQQITFSVSLASYVKTLTAPEMTKLLDSLADAAKAKFNAERI